ncbi:MAG: peptidase [Planctomycetota bacterium]|nr:MAG: peptidase [Planctomycetota bacterium]
MSCKRAHWSLLHALIIVSLGAAGAPAQSDTNDPHVAYSYPAGCEQGASIQVVIGGQYLENVNGVHIAGDGVAAEVVGWYRPMSRGMYTNLRMRLNDTREALIEEGKQPSQVEVAIAAGVTAEQIKEMEVFLKRDRDPRRQPNEQLEEELTLNLTVARDAEPGKREFRLLTDRSMSNPIWIHVGTYPEFRETEPEDGEPDEIEGELPVLVNGQIMPGDVDRFTFHATEGTRLVINAGARAVTPFLADAVPGWFQAVLTLFDSDGNVVARADSFQFHQDPVILFEAPRDDRYTVAIRDSLFRGREDFVYRMTIGETPFITSYFPLGARIGSDVTVELEGWNLSRRSVELRAPSGRRYRPVHWVSLPQEVGPALRFPLQVDRLTEAFDQEPNDDRSSAQVVDAHQVINGRIDHPGDMDVFRIETSGPLVLEVQARRHGSPLDSMLTLVDDEGNEVAFNDDHVDRSQALSTHHADSHLTAVIPSGVPHYLFLTDAQNNGGTDFVYRLYLRAREPDYELRVVPSTIIASAGATVPVTVFALRKDGFEGDIGLNLVDAADGFELHGGLIPGDAESMQMTLKLPETSGDGPLTLAMEGQARGPRSAQPLVRPAIPAENMMQAFIWHHLVPVDDWNIIVNSRKAVQSPFETANFDKPQQVPLGGRLLVPARLLDSNVPPKELRVELIEPPAGTSAEIVTDDMERFAVQITTDPEGSPGGWRGNLLLRAYRETLPAPTESDPAPTPVRTDYGLLPAFPVEIGTRKTNRTIMAE